MAKINVLVFRKMRDVEKQIQKIEYDIQTRSRLYRFFHKWHFTKESHQQHELRQQWLALGKEVQDQVHATISHSICQNHKEQMKREVEETRRKFTL